MSTLVSECFTVGSTVACRTCYSEQVEGEVLAFDVDTKMLVLKSPSSSGKENRFDVSMLNLSLVSDVQITKEATAPPEPPAHLNITKLNTRVRNQIDNKRRLVNALSSCMDPIGQKLYMSIHRIIEDVHVSGQDILVYNDITITPPYKVENMIGNPDSKPFNYIKKFVEAAEKKEALRQQAGSQ